MPASFLFPLPCMCVGPQILVQLTLASCRLFVPGQERIVQATCKHIEDLAKQGLRTFLLAWKEIPRADYDQWERDVWRPANISIEARSARMAHAYDAIEQGLRLLGGTGIEDRLQAGVPESIRAFRDAGIRLWMATGDKLSTARQVCPELSAPSSTARHVCSELFFSFLNSPTEMPHFFSPRSTKRCVHVDRPLFHLLSAVRHICTASFLLFLLRKADICLQRLLCLVDCSVRLEAKTAMW